MVPLDYGSVEEFLQRLRRVGVQISNHNTIVTISLSPIETFWPPRHHECSLRSGCGIVVGLACCIQLTWKTTINHIIYYKFACLFYSLIQTNMSLTGSFVFLVSRYLSGLWAVFFVGTQWRDCSKGPSSYAGLSSTRRWAHHGYLASKWCAFTEQPKDSGSGKRHTIYPELPETERGQRCGCGRVRLCCPKPLWLAGQPQGQSPNGM